MLYVFTTDAWCRTAHLSINNLAKQVRFTPHSIRFHGDERRSRACQITSSCIARADGLKLRDWFELTYPIYAPSIANPGFVLFEHVHKMYQNTIATWALRAQVEKGGKNRVRENSPVCHIEGDCLNPSNPNDALVMLRWVLIELNR